MPTLRPDSTRPSKAEDVKRLYESGLSVREIAKVLDISTQGVHWHLKRLGLPTDSTRKNHQGLRADE